MTKLFFLVHYYSLIFHSRGSRFAYCYIFNISISFPTSFCPSKQRKESETQCQTDCKFDLEVVESKEPVAMETRSSEYVSRYMIVNTQGSCL